jgi:hypothetical protein
VLIKIKGITVEPLFKNYKEVAEIQGHLHPAEANLGYFLTWFRPLLCPPYILKALIPLASKSHVSIKYVFNCEHNILCLDPD